MILNEINQLMAQAQPGEAAKGFTLFIVQALLLGVVCYMLFMRPQHKQAKKLQEKVDALKSGDRVVTTGGIFGIVSAVKEKTIVVKIAENTKVEMLRSGIQQVVSEEDAKEEKKS